MHLPPRPAELSVFLEALEACVQGNRPESTSSEHAARQIFSRLRTSVGECVSLEVDRLPVLDHLPPCFEQVCASQPAVRKLADAFQVLNPLLGWERRRNAMQAGKDFFEGHANCVMVGPTGLERRGDVLAGASLVAPHIDYPEHEHPPEEFYVVLAGGDWYNEVEGWYAARSADVIFHRSGIRHAMRARDKALLAVWCLWVD